MASYYDILNVSPHASDEDIKRAYRNLALKFHPDRNPNNSITAQNRFHQINEAYANIKTREKRALYNRSLRNAPRPENDNNNPGLFKTLSAFFRPTNKET